MSDKVYKLIPEPRSIVYGEGVYQLKKPLTERFQEEIAAAWHDFPHTAEKTLQNCGLKVRFFEVPNLAPRAYTITVTEGGILISAGGGEGLCHAFRTLLGILKEAQGSIRCLKIEDGPATPWRVFHLDLSVYNYRMEYLRTILEKLAVLKYNAVVVDYRGMFPYGLRYLESVYGYSREDIQRMTAFARRLGITVIPLLPVLKHAGFIWDLEPYIWLSDLPEQRDEAQAKVRTELPEAVALMQGLCRDLAEAHQGPYVFLDFAGGEEETGYCQELTRSQRDYALKLCQTLSECGKLPVVWSDILDEGLLPSWPRGGVAILRNNRDQEREKAMQEAGLQVWHSYAAVAFPATEVSMRLKTRLKAMEAIASERPADGAFVTAYMSRGGSLDRSVAPQLMQGALRMPIVMAWEAVYVAAALLWNPDSDCERLKDDWPWFYFGEESSKVREFSQFMENHPGGEELDYMASSKALMKMAAALKPRLQKDMLDLAFFYARYRLFNRYISQQFARNREFLHVNKVMTATKEMHKIWQSAMGDKLPLETVSIMQRHLFGYVEDLVRRAVRR